jgi:nitrogen regulatory protein PII
LIAAATVYPVPAAQTFVTSAVTARNTMKLKRPKLYLDVKSHLRMEIVCPDKLAETVLSTLESTAHTRLRGDGKIYVLPLEQTVRTSGGERGEAV